MKLFIKTFLILLSVLVLFDSCQKESTIETKLIGTWNRVVYDHGGTEKWAFTADKKIFVILNYEKYSIINDTVTSGNFEIKIVRDTHGNFYNKNFRKVPQITISGFNNFKYNNGQQNIWYPAYNTAWIINKLDNTTLTMSTNTYDNKPGGLEIRDFYKD